MLKIGDKFLSDEFHGLFGTKDEVYTVTHIDSSYYYFDFNVALCFDMGNDVTKLVKDNKLNQKLYPNNTVKDGYIHIKIKGVDSDE